MATFEAYVQGTEQSQSQKEKDKRTMTTEQQNVALKQKHASLLTHVQHLDQKIKGFITDDLHLTRKQHESLQDLSNHATATVEEAAAPDESLVPATAGSLAQLREKPVLVSDAVASERKGVVAPLTVRTVGVEETKQGDVNKYTKQA
jgi:L-asparaginase II